MSIFSIDHSQVTSFDLLPDGVYEAIISEVEIKVFGTGSKGLKATYTVRNDVNQEGRGRKIFDNMVVSPDAMFKFQQVASAIGMPNGKAYETAEEIMQDFQKEMLHKPVKITVKTRKYTDSNGENKQSNNITFTATSDLAAGGVAMPGDADLPPLDVEIPWEE